MRFLRRDIGRQAALLPNVIESVLVAGQQMLRVHADDAGDAGRELPGLFRAKSVILRFVGDERVIFPDWGAILAPISRQRPARERLPWIPLALSVMQQGAGGKLVPQPLDQLAGENALGGRDGGKVPLRTVRIVDGDESGLAAHGEADVVFGEVAVNGVAQ